MKSRSLLGALAVSVLALGQTMLAAPASAQTGGVRGKVIDADGHIYENQKSTPPLIDHRARL